MQPHLNHRRWFALTGLVFLLFTQTAAAMMACHQRNMMAHAGMMSPDNPCPMSPDAPTPLCAQQCDPDGNKAQALDVSMPPPARTTVAFILDTARPPVPPPFEAPDTHRKTGPPLFLALLRLLLP